MITAEYYYAAVPILRFCAGNDIGAGAVLLLTARFAVLPHGGFTYVDPGHVMYHFKSMIAPVCNPLPSLRCQSYFFSYLHKTVGAVLYFSPNGCSSIDLNFVFVLPIECSSTVGRSDAPCLRMSFRSSLIGRCFLARGPYGRAGGCSATSPSWRR